MHGRVWFTLLLAAGTAALAQPAAAETIQLRILSQPYLSADGLRVYLDIRNNGDAPALNLTPLVRFRGAESIGTFVPTLAPSTSNLQTVSVRMPDASGLRGVWPIVVRLSYADANNHPFEALHVVTLPFGTAPEASVTRKTASVRMELSSARLSTTGEVTASLHSTASMNVSLTFLVPVGLAVTPAAAPVFLNPGTRRITAFVTNAGATESSRLPAFAVAEYDIGNVHDTTIATAVVEIVPEADDRTSWIIGGVIGVLLVAWTVMFFRWRRRRPGLS